MNSPPSRIFTLTAGRTGTDWLAKFLGKNLGCKAIHEPLGVDDFGTRMPDIRLMRTFNERGNDGTVRRFWWRKLAEIGALPMYVETNHTLGKCGLVENLVNSFLANSSAIVVLRRNLAPQVRSYVARADFRNATIDWQWYLSPRYPNVIIDPLAFTPYGQIGRAAWYALEMRARQHYYVSLYSRKLRFVEVELEKVVTSSGARDFLEALGYQGDEVILPPPSNTTGKKSEVGPRVAATIDKVLGELAQEPSVAVEKYVAEGKRLGGVDLPGKAVTGSRK